ncbi:hypothetical protein Amet_2628 [Alkaliphilus metalliredigens QYMF]|uniref:Uncharacterized protein n=1 Tax=Alkaliphilus metalliredigens (strain QYMF) TaxID=293826 RepID=A6TRG2_ALKMQ|nr:hypothetical protein [Alkaliphilus metalliredigens]ABR48780.1 hypothetical protein Amet_2628 [Alkaliphilus metalliredigens QYMF]
MNFNKAVEIIEDVLTRFTILFFSMLILVIIFTNYHHYIQSVDGDSHAILSEPLVSSGSITIELSHYTTYPELEVLVNGEVYATFNDENRLVLQVFDKDLIQMNGQMYDDLITVHIVEVSENVKLILYDGQININGDIQILSGIQI